MNPSQFVKPPSYKTTKPSLKIESFLSKGKDPYEEINWVKRTAEIKNDKGEAIFIQDDVEFPDFFSQLAVNIVASKYFYGKIGTPERETSIKQLIDRVVDSISDFGHKNGYFDKENRDNLVLELRYILINQFYCFNTPVWLNVGLHKTYGVDKEDTFPNYYYDLKDGSIKQCVNEYEWPQSSACFINKIEDNMASIFEANNTEGKIFKRGSGVGCNNSNIRSSKEEISSGGIPSGPLSFMKMRDSIAGCVKSGGKCFAEGTLISTPKGLIPIEDLKIGDKVLTHKGNRKVVDFMENGKKQCFLVQTKEGYSVEVTKGHKLVYWNNIIGDFLTKPIEDFKEGDQLYILTEPCLGGKKIKLKNPKFEKNRNETTTIQMRLPDELNDKFGYVLGLLYGDGCCHKGTWSLGCTFSNDVYGVNSRKRYIKFCKELFGDAPNTRKGDGDCTVLMYTRKSLIQLLEYNNILKGKSDNLKFPKQLFQARPEIRAAFYAGVFDADGTYQKRGGFRVVMIDKKFLKNLQKLLISLGIPSKLSISRKAIGKWRNLYQLIVTGSTFTKKLYDLIKPYSCKAVYQFDHSNGANKGWGYFDVKFKDISKFGIRGEKKFIDSALGYCGNSIGYGGVCKIAENFSDSVVGQITDDLSKCVPVNIKSITKSRIIDTYDIEVEDQHLLSACGIYSSNSRRAAKLELLNISHPDIVDFIEVKKKEEQKAHILIQNGQDPSYNGEVYQNIFFQNSNLSVSVTDDFMQKVVSNESFYTKAITDGREIDKLNAKDILMKISECTHFCGDPGLFYSDTINKWHTVKDSGKINSGNPCQEFLFLDNSACNLGSINILKLLNKDNSFDLEKYKHIINLAIISQEILVDMSSYPTKEICKNSHDFRPLGLGMTNIGALVMSMGLPYDSDKGRKFIGALTSILTGQAYNMSALIAKNIGAFEGYKKNKKSMLNVIKMHLDATYRNSIYESEKTETGRLFENAIEIWKNALELGKKFGYRNAQQTLFPPTGTISFFMDAASTGVEPFLCLVQYKLLSGEGDATIKIVNNIVPNVLKKLGYNSEQIDKIIKYIDEKDTIEGCDILKEEHLSIFDCAIKPKNGNRYINYSGHIKMMAACTPYLSGAISKTVNMPEDATTQDIFDVYLEAWKIGVKDIAIYRDGSKATQPLSTSRNGKDKGDNFFGPKRIKPSKTREAITHEFEISGHKFYITVGLYDNGQPCELFIKANKTGSTINGLLDVFGISISKGLQHGIELKEFVNKMSFVKFEPYGMTGDKDIPIAHSSIDYIVRWLGIQFLDKKYKPQSINPIDGMHKEKENGNGENHTHDDTGICQQCGGLAIRSGSCHVCSNCGTTSGCS